MKVTKFDQENVSKFHDDLVAAIRSVGEKYGVTIRAGKLMYGENDFNMKIEGAVAAVAESDPYLTGVHPTFITKLQRARGYRKCFMQKISDGRNTFIVVGIRGGNLLGKKEGEPTGGLWRLPINNPKFPTIHAEIMKIVDPNGIASAIGV